MLKDKCKTSIVIISWIYERLKIVRQAAWTPNCPPVENTRAQMEKKNARSRPSHANTRTRAFIQACADETSPAEFLYGEHEAGLVTTGFLFGLVSDDGAKGQF